MKAEVCSVSYAVDVTRRQFDKLEAFDQRWIDGKSQIKTEDWFKDLPVFDIEFNGHFGSTFYFRVDASSFEEAEQVKSEVLSILSRKLK